MNERYVGTFDSLAPLRGVVVDEEGGRYCTFPSLEKAQGAAARWNQLPLIEFDPPMAWRSVETGELLESTNRTIRHEDVHWIGDAPTSLHGNGAGIVRPDELRPPRGDVQALPDPARPRRPHGWEYR